MELGDVTSPKMAAFRGGNPLGSFRVGNRANSSKKPSVEQERDLQEIRQQVREGWN